MARVSARKHPSRLQGFTLVELSVVLIIIGLIVGGVIAGRSMIRTAQIQSVITDVNRFADAMRQFQQKYKYLPGDFPNATSFWGANGGGVCASASATTPTGTSTCNGNGDGLLQGGYGDGLVDVNETFLAWRHLSNAGMVEGSYTGRDGGAAGVAVNNLAPGSNNVPLSRVKGGSFTATTNINLWEPQGGTWTYPSRNVSLTMLFGAGTKVLGAIISTKEAYSLDAKMDDGRPGLGKVRTPRNGSSSAGWGAENCADNYDPTLAAYSFTQEGELCSLMIDID